MSALTLTVPRTKTELRKVLAAERKAVREALRAQLANKGDVQQTRTAERKSMRAKHQQSAFLRQTLNIYKGMKTRAQKLDRLSEIDFEVSELREVIQPRLTLCAYCGGKITPSNWTVDHEEPIARTGTFALANLQVCCKPCNWQKGIMSGYEWRCFLLDYLPNLPAEVQTDIKRRLTIGGKWSFGR